MTSPDRGEDAWGEVVDEEESRPYPDRDHSIAPRKPRTVGGVVYLGVLAGTAAGLVLVVLGPWRTGLWVVGGSMIAGATIRLVLPDRSAGMLGVRRKLIDVATMALLGVALCTLAVVIPDQPPI